jgi:basic membrane protein A
MFRDKQSHKKRRGEINMKKLLSILGAVGIVASSASTVVACGPKKTFSDIFLITDTGKVNDKSFNESGYNGGNNFVKTALGKSENVSYVEPSDETSMKSSYAQAVGKGAKSLILPGFQHQGNTAQIQKALGDDKSAVFLDGDTNQQANIIGLKYKADISGFEAGLASAIWFFQNNKDANELKMATYGGLANPVAVTSYMSGFLAAIDGFNTLMKNETFKNTFFKDDTRETLTVSRVDSQKSITADNDKSWFTGSFDAGAGKDISDTLLSGGAQIVFPVAGPQTLDTLAAIKESGKTAYVDGVDTDQVLSYSEYKNSFITSGLKALVGSTEVALAHTKEYKDSIKQDKLEELAHEGNIELTDIAFVDGKTDEDITDATKIKELQAAGSDWDGLEAWFGGDIAHDGNNKLSGDLYNQIKDFLTGNGIDLSKASAEFFKSVQIDGTTSATLLGTDYINTWLTNAGITGSSENN